MFLVIFLHHNYALSPSSRAYIVISHNEGNIEYHVCGLKYYYDELNVLLSKIAKVDKEQIFEIGSTDAEINQNAIFALLEVLKKSELKSTDLIIAGNSSWMKIPIDLEKVRISINVPASAGVTRLPNGEKESPKSPTQTQSVEKR
jgi:hypothetical protein